MDSSWPKKIKKLEQVKKKKLLIIIILQLQQAECQTPDKIQDVLDNGCSAVKEIKSLQQQHKQLSAKVDSHVQKLHPLAERLSCLVSQIAEVERFRAYVSWIQRIESVRWTATCMFCTYGLIWDTIGKTYTNKWINWINRWINKESVMVVVYFIDTLYKMQN